MEIRSIDDEHIWTDFLLGLNKNTFLQAWPWVEFCRQTDSKVWTLGLFDTADDRLISIAFVQKVEARRGTFLQCSHGPQSAELSLDHLQAWTNYFKKLAKEENCAFVRLSPVDENTSQIRQIFTKAGWRPAPIHAHAEMTTLVDLTGTEDEVRSRIKKNTRYELRKAEKLVREGRLTVQYVQEIDEEMYQVYEQTVDRGGFVPFSLEHLRQECQAFVAKDGCVVINIRYDGRLVSWGLIIFFGQRAFYHQGANMLVKGVPAPTLLQWLGIQQSKQRGCVTYDLWGVAPEADSDHPWASISRFKRGFGGQDLARLPTQDLVVKPLRYWFTSTFEKFRKARRGFGS